MNSTPDKYCDPPSALQCSLFDNNLSYLFQITTSNNSNLSALRYSSAQDVLDNKFTSFKLLPSISKCFNLSLGQKYSLDLKVQLPDFSELLRMSWERDNNGERAMLIKKEERTEGRSREEENLRKPIERVGTVEKFLKQRGRMTEAPIIKKEARIKKEGGTDEGWKEKERPKHGREWADREAKKEEEDRCHREKRLRAIQEEPGEKPKSWLTNEMEKKAKFEEPTDEPTEEDIKLQLRLPNPTNIKEFKEPVKEWKVNNFQKYLVLSLLCVQGV